MTSLRTISLVICAQMLLSTSWSLAEESLSSEVYGPMNLEDVRSKTVLWVAKAKVQDQAVKEQVAKLWTASDDDLNGSQLLDRAVQSFRLVDKDTAKLLADCKLLKAPLLAPRTDLLSQKGLDPFYAHNMRLWVGRYFTQRRMYDEALDLFDSTDAKQVIDPASLFYFRAVCQQQLLQISDARKSLKTLLQNTESVPMRYQTVATLMDYALNDYKDGSLDEVSRHMDDVERRLDLGRSGARVQRSEQKAIALLNEIIEKLEQQSGGGSGSGEGDGQNNSNQPGGSPAQDSKIKGSTAPGNVDKKSGIKKGWGGLDPKELAKVKSMIDRNFPAQYYQAFKKYSLKQAEREAKKN